VGRAAGRRTGHPGAAPTGGGGAASHAESTRIQVGLREKAVPFGWGHPVTILDDLGISATGFAHRAGFQHLVADRPGCAGPPMARSS